jgi:hypothetical protein
MMEQAKEFSGDCLSPKKPSPVNRAPDFRYPLI